jgi:putative selenate reductase
VQILDELKIPRPCIDMRNVGYNVEWSQELKLEQSLVEYVKASMLIEILQASGQIPLVAGATDIIFDMSVGYDLEGIRSERVQAFIAGMMDASAVVDTLRREIPDAFRQYRDLPFRTDLSRSLTLSTFHGCPPDEIERIIDFLLRQVGLHCIIKLNPTLLGPQEARRLLHEQMGYVDARIPDTAFANDTQWPQALGFIERLKVTADERHLGLGVKFSNTLIVEHDGDFLPASESQKYLSGPPLHVLAMNLVMRLRQHFGNRIPISFSAGIDRGNFADAVALGLVPITVCSDLLKPGGYARQITYLTELQRRMDAVGARSIDEFVALAYGEAAADDGNEALSRNTNFYVRQASADPRYAWAGNQRLPKKVGSTLELFNCLTCDKCIPVCPNDANFMLVLPPREEPLSWSRMASRTIQSDPCRVTEPTTRPRG